MKTFSATYKELCEVQC